MAHINIINFRAAGAAVVASVVVVSFVAAPVVEHRAVPDVRTVSMATTQLLSVNWDVFDHVVAQHAQSVAALVSAPAPSAGSSSVPKVVAVTPTRSATAQPAGVVAAIESAITSTLSSAFLFVVKPLVSNPALAPIFGPFVFVGAIFFGLFVGVPIVAFNSIFAPILNLLPFAAVSGAATQKSAASAPKQLVSKPTSLKPTLPKSVGRHGKPVAAASGVDKGTGKSHAPSWHGTKTSHKGSSGHSTKGDS